MRTAIYPGTFDPVTYGHVHIAERASKLFEKVVIAVAENNYKNNLFTLEERMYLVAQSTKHLDNVKVDSFSGLVANYATKKRAQALIRGLRAVSDFEYELQLASMNRHLNENLETLFLMAQGEYSFLSSSIIKQVATVGGSIKGLVPEIVEEKIKEKFLTGTIQK